MAEQVRLKATCDIEKNEIEVSIFDHFPNDGTESYRGKIEYECVMTKKNGKVEIDVSILNFNITAIDENEKTKKYEFVNNKIEDCVFSQNIQIDDAFRIAPSALTIDYKNNEIIFDV